MVGGKAADNNGYVVQIQALVVVDELFERDRSSRAIKEALD